MTDRVEHISEGKIESAATFLLGAAFLLRMWIPGGAAGIGTNAFVHSLFLTGAFLGIISILRKPTVEVRFSGMEIPLTIFVLLGIFSVTWASYKLPALQSALAYGAFAIFAFTLPNAFRRRPQFLCTLLFGFLFVLSIYCLIQKFVLLPEARAAGANDPRFQGTEMAARLASGEIFGTFLYPNSLAGFLVFALPVAGGLLLDLKKGRLPGILLVVLGGIVLFLTGSRGGWVAFGLAMLFLVALILTRNRERLRKLVWLATGTGTLLAVGLVLAGPLAPGKLDNASMRMRDLYWSAAIKIAKDHPLHGVGLDNFQEYYPEYKGETQQETRKVHNDYLQILVELGIPGLLALLAVVGCGLRHAMRRPRDSIPVHPQKHERRWLIATGITSLFLAWLIEGSFGFLWTLVLAGSWTLFVWFWHPWQPRGNMEGTRLGCIAGVCGLLIHMTVDFDLYEFGVAATLFFGLSLIPLLGGRMFTLTVGREVSIAFSILLGVVLIPLLLLVVPRLLEADRIGREADRELQEATALGLFAREAMEQGDKVRWEEARIKSDGKYSRSMELYLEAQQKNPFDATSHLEYGALSLQLWERIQNTNRSDEKTLSNLVLEESRTITALENALAVRPRSIPAESLLTKAHFRFANHYARSQKNLHLQMEKKHLQKALEHSLKTTELYPTRAHAHYEAGRILARSGRLEEAAVHYTKALHLSQNAGKEGLERLQLNEVQKVRALFRVGREKEANAILKNWFEAELKLFPEKRRHIETLLGREGRGEKLKPVFGEEFDSFLAPKIVTVLKNILASLPE